MKFLLAVVFALVATTHSAPSNPCYPNPCERRTCLQSSDFLSFVCICEEGFYGNTCQYSGCDSNPCLNDATCMTSALDPTRYICVCASGYSGSTCQNRQVDPCLNNPCQNGGTCQQEADGGYSCKCDPRYGGAQCLQQMTCALNPCKNGGLCYLNYNDGINYMCMCPDNFKGKDCSKPDPCSSNPCANNNVCLTEDDDSYSCLCRCGTDGSCNNTDNGGDGGSRPSEDDIQCDNLKRASGNCTGRGECAFDANRMPFCRCDASYYGTHCQYTVSPTPSGGGDGDGTDTGTFQNSFMCPDTSNIIGCRSVFSEMDKCNDRGCCSSDLQGGAKCSCSAGYGGNKCQYDCDGAGCSSSGQNAANGNGGTGGTGGSGNNGDGTGGTGSGGTGTGTGTSGTGTNGGSGVRPQVDGGPLMCPGEILPIPILECNRVWNESSACNNHGCCKYDDGDARCKCDGGYGGNHCQSRCEDNQEHCGTTSGGTQ